MEVTKFVNTVEHTNKFSGNFDVYRDMSYKCYNFFLSVVRAKILSSRPKAAYMPNSGNKLLHQVYKLRILDTFKGLEHVQRNNLISSESLYFVNLFTPSFGMSPYVRLEPDDEYLLFGEIIEGHLYTSFCDWRQKWANVTLEQREGVQTQYSKGCPCKIGFCFAQGCSKRLTGCDGFDRSFKCRAKYGRCEMKIGGQKCSWRASWRFKQCTKIYQRFFP